MKSVENTLCVKQTVGTSFVNANQDFTYLMEKVSSKVQRKIIVQVSAFWSSCLCMAHMLIPGNALIAHEQKVNAEAEVCNVTLFWNWKWLWHSQ